MGAREANVPPIFLLNNRFFLGGGDYQIYEGQIKKKKYFIYDHMGGVKTKKK